MADCNNDEQLCTKCTNWELLTTPSTLLHSNTPVNYPGEINTVQLSSKIVPFQITFEILDNLVHDKVIMSVKTGDWMQARVKREREGKDRVEFYEPITDEESKRVLNKVVEVRKSLPIWTHLSDAVKRMFKKRDVSSTADLTRNQTIYLPTGCSFALQNLREFVPGHRLVFADFDALPEAKMDGLNAPVVASQGTGGKTYDRNSYLEGVVGSSDVFFPTCFDTLKLLNENKGMHLTTKEFMEKYSERGACETKRSMRHEVLLDRRKRYMRFVLHALCLRSASLRMHCVSHALYLACASSHRRFVSAALRLACISFRIDDLYLLCAAFHIRFALYLLSHSLFLVSASSHIRFVCHVLHLGWLCLACFVLYDLSRMRPVLSRILFF